jgi:transposase
MADSLVTIAEKALDSETCHCGNVKSTGHFVCWRCYRRLPADIKRALNYGGEAGAVGYDAAKDWLREND